MTPRSTSLARMQMEDIAEHAGAAGRSWGGSTLLIDLACAQRMGTQRLRRRAMTECARGAIGGLAGDSAAGVELVQSSRRFLGRTRRPGPDLTAKPGREARRTQPAQLANSAARTSAPAPRKPAGPDVCGRLRRRLRAPAAAHPSRAAPSRSRRHLDRGHENYDGSTGGGRCRRMSERGDEGALRLDRVSSRALRSTCAASAARPLRFASHQGSRPCYLLSSAYQARQRASSVEQRALIIGPPHPCPPRFTAWHRLSETHAKEQEEAHANCC